MEPPEDDDVPEISAPVITACVMLEDAVRLTFTVQTVNGVALQADSFTWFVDSAADPQFFSTDNGRIIGQDAGVRLVSPASIAADAGVPLTVTVEVSRIEGADARFYRIRAWRKD
jgi:hypothetical protein